MRMAAALVSLFVAGCGDNLVPEAPGDAMPPPDDNTGQALPLLHPKLPKQPSDVVACLAPPILRTLSSTATSVTIEVCAGDSALPAGFAVQWSLTCGAGFGEENFDSRFALAAGACTNVTIGRLFDEDPGVAFTCDELTCGTEHTFRAYANATETACASELSSDVLGSTAACEPPRPDCTLTQGYWKNHGDWPVSELALGNRSYSAAEVLAAFHTPARGNGLLILEHQLAAAKLNIAAGANPAAIAATITTADALIGDAVVPPMGSGYLAPSTASPIADTLASYNEGAIGPGHCD